MEPRTELQARAKRRATNLRRMRKRRGMSAPQFAKLCGMGPSFLLDMELGRYAITLKTIDRIADGLKVTPLDVLAELDGLRAR